jgi:hypothetical protein
VPVQLFAASGDRDVPIANAFRCRDALTARGATVDLVDLGAVDHASSALRSIPLALDRLRAVPA